MSFEILTAHGVDAAIWRTLHAQLPLHLRDVHFTPEYAAALEDEHTKARLAVHRIGDLFTMQPYLHRIVTQPEGYRGLADAVNPYGFGGPIGTGVMDLWSERFRVAMEDQNVVCAFTTLHPLKHHWQKEIAAGTYVKDIAVMDISQAPTLEGCSRHTRRDILKAREASAMVFRERIDDIDVQFIELYLCSMKRLRAAPRWNLVEAIRHWMEMPMTRIFTANYKGKVERALMVIQAYGTAYAHMLGSTGEHRDLGLDALLYFEAATKLREDGCHHFVLGGGRTSDPNDSLLNFKLGLGKERYPVHSMFTAYDNKAYAMLCSDKRAAEIAEHGRESLSGFLPVYRREFI